MARYAALFFVFSLLLVFGTGCATVHRDVVRDAGRQSETRIYEVLGMDCPGCHGGLIKLVEKIPTVQGAEANWVKKQLVVTLRPEGKLNDEDVYDAVRRANLTVGKRIK